MPISCEPDDLALAATCFSGLSWRQRQEIRVYLLCTLVNGDTPVDCTPDALAAAAACYSKLSSGQLDQIETYLFCQLASAGPAPPAATTIYSGDGTLAGNRTVSGAGNSLIINGLSEFEAACTNGVDAAFTDIGSDYVDIKVSGVGAIGEIFMQKDSLQVSIPGNGAQYGITGQKVGFMGATPVARIASADQAIATDPASTMALANALRAALIPSGGFGLIKGSA